MTATFKASMKIQGSQQGQMCLLILLNATALGNWVFSLCLQAVSIIASTRNLKLPHSKSALSFLHHTWDIQGVFSSFPAYPGGLKFPNRQKLLRLQKKWEGVEALQ